MRILLQAQKSRRKTIRHQPEQTLIPSFAYWPIDATKFIFKEALDHFLPKEFINLREPKLWIYLLACAVVSRLPRSKFKSGCESVLAFTAALFVIFSPSDEEEDS